VGDIGIGVVLSAFVVFNGVVTLPAGYLADRWVRTRAVAIAMGAWSVVSVAGAMAPTFSVLVFLRGVLGFGQGVTDPSTGSLLPDYYELERRGRVFSVQQSLILVGTGVGVLAGGIIGPTLGWRAAFVFTSIPGLVVAFLIYRLREPKREAADRLRMGVTDRIEYADEAVLDGTADAEPRQPFFEDGAKRFTVDLLVGLRRDVGVILAIPTLRGCREIFPSAISTSPVRSVDGGVAGHGPPIRILR
jgi:MFS family permease